MQQKKEYRSGSYAVCTLHVIPAVAPEQPEAMTIFSNTPGTAGGPGGRDRTLAVKV